jgi:hypothetical protein
LKFKVTYEEVTKELATIEVEAQTGSEAFHKVQTANVSEDELKTVEVFNRDFSISAYKAKEVKYE